VRGPGRSLRRRPEEAAAAFDRLDLDRNGVLDTAELTVALSQFFASRAGPVDRVLRPVG
jgi:Ca2+-binding EF-hand superfamily protein